MEIDVDLQDLIERALVEDLGERGDITTAAMPQNGKEARATITSKESGWIAGGAIAEAVFLTVQPRLRIDRRVSDGCRVDSGTVLLVIDGPAQDILIAERTALNFLGHLSGIASLTGRFTQAIAHTRAKMLDTRKTTPGLRRLQKYAVSCGGGVNHRMGLYDMFLIKENHITTAGGIAAAVDACRDYQRRHGFKAAIEVETTSPNQVMEAIALQVDRIMLDNMTTEMMRLCVEMVAHRIPVEASGNIDFDRVRSVAETGVDFISSGALTHSAPNLDLSLLLQLR